MTVSIIDKYLSIINYNTGKKYRQTAHGRNRRDIAIDPAVIKGIIKNIKGN